MPIYVAEISGRALAAMNAETTFTAEDRFGGPAFHRELTVLLDEDGNPLWDGEAEIHVRAANSSRRRYGRGSAPQRSGRESSMRMRPRSWCF
jgi:hypothetical protein